MNTIKLVVLSTLMAAAVGSAAAQSGLDREEQLRQSSEMNRPLTQGSAQGGQRSRMVAPVSQAERNADEVRKNTDMMRPSTLGTPVTSGRSLGVVPLNEADRKVAETIQRTDRMKPN
jgi:hypothetical protein